MPLTFTSITGTFDDGSGAALSGSVAFTPSATLYASGIPVAQPGVPVLGQIVNGALKNASGGTLTLLATDNTGITVEGQTGFWYWTVQVTVAGQVQPSWSFFLPSSPSTVDLYKLANTAAGGGGGGITPPAGDIGGTTSAPTVTGTHLASPLPLAQGGTANTSGTAVNVSATLDQLPAPAANVSMASHKVTNLANGAAAQDAAAFGQIPSIPSSLPPNGSASGDLSGTYPGPTVAKVNGVTVTGTPSAGFVPTATGGTAATWQAPTGGFQAWQFQPETYGAKGDGKVIADAVLNSTTTLTSATANFTSADTGKHIMINGAIGGTNIPLITTMTFVNATTVTLSSAASVTGTAFQAVYGTDDTAAINSAMSAAKTYALANQYFAEVVFGAKYYVLSSGPTQSTSPQFNAQIPMPYPDLTGAGRKLVIALTGAGDNGFYQYWQSTTPNVAGTALVSMSLAPTTVSPTFGQQSVLGGPSAGGAFTGGFANVKVVVKGIEVVCSAYTNQYAFDFGYLSAMRIVQSSAHIFAPAGIGGGNSPLLKDLPSQLAFTNTIGCGLRAPTGQNNADTTAEDFTAEGYARGLYVFDHFQGGRISTIYNDVAVVIDPTLGSSLQHAIVIAMLGAEAYNGGILVAGGSSGQIPVYINLDAECGAPAYDIADNGSALRGVVHWMDPADSRAPGINGAANLKVINDKLGPGAWTGAMVPPVPAAPATGVAQQNTAYRDATVWVTSTAAITAVAVDSTTVFSGSIAIGVPFLVRVPGGHSYTVTSSGGTLTTHWVLE